MCLALNSWGQKPWTLEECVMYAYDNNLQIKQSSLSVEMAEVNKDAAWANMAPNLNFSTGYFWQFGNSIDPTTNTRVQGGSNIQTSSSTISSSWILFNGLQNTNTIKQTKLDHLASLYNLEAMKNDVAVNIAAQYLQVLFDKEILNIADKQLSNSERLMLQTKKRYDAGAVAKGDLLQLEAQVSSDEQSHISSENALRLSLLQLAQTLQLDTVSGFDIITPIIDIPESYLMTMTSEDIFNQAVGLQPNVKSAELNLESSEHSISIAKGNYIPTLSLSAQLNTNFSSRSSNYSISDPELVQIGFTDPLNLGVYRYQSELVNDGLTPFGDQYTNNVNQFVGLNLQIPIFNNFQNKRNVSNSVIQMENNKIALDQEIMSFRQTIQRAHSDALASYKSYQAASKSVVANEESFSYAEKRREEGAINIYDYENARFQYLNAVSQQLQSKYDYIFKIEVLEFYLHQKITLQ